MKIGLLAYATKTGLGYQTKSFYDNIKVDKVLLVDLSKHNCMPIFPEWYVMPRTTDGYPTDEECKWLVQDMDIVFVCENPLNYSIFEYARMNGTKVIQQCNPEFLEYFRNPLLPAPTVIANPSNWMTEKIKALKVAPVQLWTVPIKLHGVGPEKPLRNFVHIVGRPAANDRNGTLTYLEAIQRLGKQYTYKIYIQPPLEPRGQAHYIPIRNALLKAKEILGDNLEIVDNVDNNVSMYIDTDCLVLPRRYGGLCLPMQEALSFGIPVIMPNISPNRHILPKSWLVEAKVNNHLKTQTNITLYDTDVDLLVEKMLFMAKNIDTQVQRARKVAWNMSWEIQKDIYLKRFQELCT